MTTEDFDKALAFYRDALGPSELPSVASADGRVVILDAGREIADSTAAESIDQVEVGRASP